MEEPGGKDAVKMSEEVATMMMTNEILGSEHPAACRQEGEERLAAEWHKKCFRMNSKNPPWQVTLQFTKALC